jgi:hypothetical protein
VRKPCVVALAFLALAGCSSRDIAFVAVDPARSAEIAQSTPYVVIEGAAGVKQQLIQGAAVAPAGDAQ